MQPPRVVGVLGGVHGEAKKKWPCQSRFNEKPVGRLPFFGKTGTIVAVYCKTGILDAGLTKNGNSMAGFAVR